MKLEPKTLLPPLVAILVLVLVVQQVRHALQISGAWLSKSDVVVPRPPDPYARLDGILARPTLERPAGGLRDPFLYVRSTAPVAQRSTHRPARPAPAPPPRPVLTAIIWDEDPRATIRYEDRDFSVRQNSLFADFRVRSITSTQVVLERGGEPLVLTLRSKGE